MKPENIALFLIGKAVPSVQVVTPLLNRSSEYRIDYFVYADGLEALRAMDKHSPHLALVDVDTSGFTAPKLVSYLRAELPSCEIVVVGDPNRAREKIKQLLEMGADDCLFLPLFDLLPVQIRLRAALDKVLLTRRLEEDKREEGHFPSLVGNSPPFRRLLSRLGQSAPLTRSCLLIGEEGVGKKSIAKVLVMQSAVKHHAISVSYLPHKSKSELKQEWESFKNGQHGTGVLYMEGLEDLDPGRQQNLYGLMKEFETDTGSFPLVFAARPALLDKVRRGLFRQDLFHLLSECVFIVPPLRERREDIPLLIDYFNRQWSKKSQSLLSVLSKEAYDLLWAYDWPGNLRQLRQVVEACLAARQGLESPIQVEDLPENLLSRSPYTLGREEERDLFLAYHEAKEKSLAKFHEKYIIYLLKRTKGNISAAALKAGLDRSNFRKLMKKYHVKIS